MKKECFMVLMAGILGICALTGCRKAPEASSDSDILHAKSSAERDVENITAEDTAEEESGTDPGGIYDALIGTEENGIRICAKLPTVPDTIPTLTIGKRDDLDGDKLKALLDSESKDVKDITAAYLAQREKELSEMSEDDIPSEWVYFGDDSNLIFSDGQKEASFARNTSASYEDERLKKSCDAIYKKAPEINVTQDGEAASAKFSAARAEEILLNKLAVLDITEIHLTKALYYELEETAFYELHFTPSYEKTGIAAEFGQLTKGEIHPQGTAWITEDGIAMLSLEDCCGKITDQSGNGKILTFSQVTGILEKYLENNTLLGLSDAELTQVELVYYPDFQKPELILTPAWHIYTPLEQKIDSDDEVWNRVFERGAATNIYLDAVTGELIKAE